MIAGCLAIMLLGWGLRLAYHQASPILSRDAVAYVRIADGRIAEPDNAVPLLLVTVLRWGKNFGCPTERWGLEISLWAGILLIAEGWGLGRMIFRSDMVAALTAFLLAVNPQLIRQSTQIQKESLFLVLLGAALLMAFAADRGTSRAWLWWGLSGMLIVLATGMRHDGLEYVLAIPLLAGIGIWKTPNWKQRTFMAMGFPVGVVLTAVLLGCFSDNLQRIMYRL